MAGSRYLFGRSALGSQKTTVTTTPEVTLTLTESFYRVYVLGADVHFSFYGSGDGGSGPGVVDFTADADNASGVFFNGDLIEVDASNYDKVDLLTDSGTATVWFTPFEARS